MLKAAAIIAFTLALEAGFLLQIATPSRPAAAATPAAASVATQGTAPCIDVGLAQLPPASLVRI